MARRRPKSRALTRRSFRLLWAHEYRQFRERLVEARESAGLTQRDAAERLGRSQSYIANSESGERRVDAVEIAKFAELYRKPLWFFFPFFKGRT